MMLRKSFLSIFMAVAVMLMTTAAFAATTVTIQTNGGADFTTTDASENVLSYASLVNGSGADVMFVLDSSGSMGWNDTSNQRLTAAVNLINSLPAGSNVAVAAVDFDSGSSVVSSFLDNYPTTSDYSHAITAINNINSSGGTNLDAGLSAANTEFLNHGRTGYDWIEVFLTDGYGSYTYAGGGGPIDTAASLGITVHTFGLGLTGTSLANIQDMANATGGTCENTLDPNNLPDLFGGIGGALITGAEYELDDGTILDAYGTFTLGYFNANIPLHIGANPIIARAFGSDGTYGEDLITINRPIPEPATMLLLGSGLVGLAGFSRKKKSKK